MYMGRNASLYQLSPTSDHKLVISNFGAKFFICAIQNAFCISECDSITDIISRYILRLTALPPISTTFSGPSLVLTEVDMSVWCPPNLHIRLSFSDFNFRTLTVHLLWMYLALLLWAYGMTAVSSPRSSARLPYWDAWVARGRYYTSPPPRQCNPFANNQEGAVCPTFNWDQRKGFPRILES